MILLLIRVDLLDANHMRDLIDHPAVRGRVIDHNRLMSFPQPEATRGFTLAFGFTCETA
jgi:hypothetical protein